MIAAFSVGPVSAATAKNVTTVVAQAATTGAITGTALDESGSPVSGASVMIRGGQTYTTTTDAKGSFTVENIEPGLYIVSIRKAGYETATQPDFAIFSGEVEKVAVTMHSATLTTLRTIASIRAVGRGTFNTSAASVSTISAATYANQGQQQVTRVLNQVPGVQISLPGNSANDAVPGAITFPNVRNGLSFETASLIDGHPVSVGLYGDYVTTFLNSAMFGSTDIIKGPGANSPEVNYAIGGTINFRTKDPTQTATPTYTIGVTNHGGSFYDFGISDTISRLGFVAEIAGVNDPSALHGQQYYYDPGAGNVTLLNGKELFDSPAFNTLAPTSSKIKDGYHTIACCATLYGDYDNTTELLKARYKFSSATTATVSYLGGQTFANQTGNTSELGGGATFNPGAGYSGSLAGGPISALFGYYATSGTGEREINNEPILQGEVSTTLGNDTILARYYHATINRQKLGGGPNPLVPTTMSVPVWGTASGFAPFNGTTQNLQVYDYYDNPETDRLSGLSFSYDHPINNGNGDITFAVDQTNSNTIVKSTSVSYNYNGQQCPYDESQTLCANTSTSLPSGASQLFTTFLLRGHDQLTNKLSATLSLYSNTYRNTYPTDCSSTATKATATTVTSVVCRPDGTIDTAVYTKASKTTAVTSAPVAFATTSTSHFDPRLALEYRMNADTSLRFAAGSSIAPPYISLLSKANGSTSYSSSTGNVYQTINSGAFLKPETAFGYDLGGDIRLKDKVTFVSADVYLTNLFNQFIAQTYDSGLTCGTISGVSCPATAGVTPATPVFYSANVNLSNARYEGIELSIKRIPEYGFGYELSGSTQRGYVYNLPACFYSTTGTNCTLANAGTNLAVIANQNFTGGGIGFNSVSNQNVPYLQGHLELNYTFKNGAYAAFGDTLYGKNNSLNEPPFGIAYATVRSPFTKDVSVQISGDNIFNAYSGLIPVYGGGVAVPLVNGGSGATLGNVVGPATYRFELTKTLP